MSRILKIMVALLAIAAIAAPAVFAEDRLSINGELRVRGFIKDNNADFNDNLGGAAGKTEYIDQRFRLGGTIAVSEGVQVKFRYDLWDEQWGGATTTNGNGLNDPDNFAYLVINKGMFTLNAGDQAHALGNAIAIDTVGTGFVLDIDAAPVGVQLTAFKLDEDNTDEDDDADLYTLAVSHKTDMYNGTVFAGFLRDGDVAMGNDAVETYVYGVAADFNLDAANVKFEANYFDGDNGQAGVNNIDSKGLQFYLDGSMDVSETASVGAIFTYAKGYNDATEAQTTNLSDDGSFMPETYGYMATLFSAYPGETFDPTNDGLGTIGLQAYSTLKLTDDLSLKATVFYATPEEDYTAAQLLAETTAYDYFLGGVLSSTYTIAEGAAIDTSVAYTTVDSANAATEDDPSLVAGFRLRVRF